MPGAFARTTRALEGDDARSAWRGWAIAGITLTLWTCWFFMADITLYEASPQARLEVAHAAHPLAASVSGTVERSHLRLGDTVQAGDVLVELDASRERSRLAEARAHLEALPAQLAAIRAEIDAEGRALAGERAVVNRGDGAVAAHVAEARAAARYSADRYARLQELAAAHQVPEIEVLRARAEADKAAAAVRALRESGRRDNADAGSRVAARHADIQALQRRLAELEGMRAAALASVARLENEIEKHRVRAPVGGTVGDIASLEVGAYAAAGKVLGQIVPGGRLLITADFAPAAVLGRIHAGQRARLRLDGFPWAQYGAIDAHVRRVASEVRNARIRVELIPHADRRTARLLQHGLPGAVEVAIETTTPALLVLRAAGQLFAEPVAAGAPGA